MGSVIGVRSVRSLHPSLLSKRRPGGYIQVVNQGVEMVWESCLLQVHCDSFFLWFGMRISCVIVMGSLLAYPCTPALLLPYITTTGPQNARMHHPESILAWTFPYRCCITQPPWSPKRMHALSRIIYPCLDH